MRRSEEMPGAGLTGNDVRELGGDAVAEGAEAGDGMEGVEPLTPTGDAVVLKATDQRLSGFF
jgi:hypothetical protein